MTIVNKKPESLFLLSLGENQTTLNLNSIPDLTTIRGKHKPYNEEGEEE
jgi:hypothetical protein